MRLIWHAICVVFALSCGAEKPADPSCQTAQCRQDAVIAAWAQDQAAALALMDALPDSLERLAAVARLVDLYPAEIGPLCEQLQAGRSRNRCTRAANRNHLHATPPELEVATDASRPLSPHARLAALLVRDSPLVEMTPDMGPCQGILDATSCLIQAGRRRVGNGDLEGGAGICMAIPLLGDPPQRWRSECFFELAEHHLEGKGVDAYASSAGLCSAAEVYMSHCQQHLLTLLARIAPSADEANPEAWAAVSRAADTVATAWADSAGGRIMVSSYWALAIAISMDSASKVSGDALEYLPPVAEPHLRAGASARLMKEQGAASRDLEGWVKTVTAALSKRSQADPSNQPHEVYSPPKEIWPGQLAKEQGMSTVQYRGIGLRVVADDPRADTAICVLEAAARQETVHMALFEEGSKHADPSVRWTATTLLNWLSKRSRSMRPPAPGVNR